MSKEIEYNIQALKHCFVLKIQGSNMIDSFNYTNKTSSTAFLIKRGNFLAKLEIDHRKNKFLILGPKLKHDTLYFS